MSRKNKKINLVDNNNYYVIIEAIREKEKQEEQKMSRNMNKEKQEEQKMLMLQTLDYNLWRIEKQIEEECFTSKIEQLEKQKQQILGEMKRLSKQ